LRTLERRHKGCNDRSVSRGQQLLLKRSAMPA
jgi:hypothetical protein